MLPEGVSYEEIRARFRWHVPARYNIGVDACDRWADGSGRLALIHLRADGATERAAQAAGRGRPGLGNPARSDDVPGGNGPGPGRE